jgi:hypothetical protein
LISLKIHHKTTYRFNKPVALGPHRFDRVKAAIYD